MCNKVAYEDKKAALTDAKIIRVGNRRWTKRGKPTHKTGKKLSAYSCLYCGKWHLTTQKQRK